MDHTHAIKYDKIPLRLIKLDEELQPRCEIDRATVEEYSQCLIDGGKLPPVVVFDDGDQYFDGDAYWLADGYHRFFAHSEIGLVEIDAEIRVGSWDDALDFSLAANHSHGKRMTRADYRRAYERAVEHHRVLAFDAITVAKLLRCSSRWATELTADARKRHEAEKDAQLSYKAAEGKTHQQIANEMDMPQSTVGKRLERLSKECDPKKNTSFTGLIFDGTQEIPAETVIGEVAKKAFRWKVSNQLIIQSDCLTQLLQMETASIDVVVTSPPYNIGIEYGSHDDNMATGEYIRWLTAIAIELRRVMKPAGSFFLNIGSTNTDPWIEVDVAMAMRDIFVLQNYIIWVKSIAIGRDMIGHYKPINSGRFLNNNYESIFHFTVNGDVEIDRLAIGRPYEDKSNIERRGHLVDAHCAGNAWFIPYDTVQSKAEKFDHPAGFPIGLPERCLRMHGLKDGLVVLDPFLGAGTTLVAAKRLGCQGIGIEVDPEYARAAIARIECVQ